MKNILIANTLLLLVFSCKAQAQKQPGKAVFRSIQQVSLINGNDAVSAGLQTVNGIAAKGWFAGVGVGLDFYRYRSVPLFIDLRKEIPIKKNKLFVYADGGYNLPWVKNQDVYREWTSNGFYKEEYDYKGREYIDAGLGYAIDFKSGNAFLLSAGYSYKAFDASKTTTSKWGIGTPQETQQVDEQKFAYRFNRIMVKIGWQF